jgi:voltage-gated potassium channel
MTSLRRRTYEVLEGSAAEHVAGRVLNALLVCLIVGNVVAVMLDSEAAISDRYHHWLQLFQWVSVLLFTVEYGARVWAAVERDDRRYAAPLWGRLRYMLTPMALIDLVAILPFYLSFLLPVDLLFMRVFRLFLVIKLTRYQASMSLLAGVLRNEAGPIAAAIFVLAMLLVVAASFAFLAEHDAQPEVFASIPDAMWWAIVTMTTVGYGDMVPVTPLGKLVGGLIAIIGIGMVALPAGLLASGFSEQLHQRRREFEKEVDRVLRSGTITPEEGDRLKELRDRLGLSDHQAAEIARLILQRRSMSKCPHCGAVLTDPAGGDPAPSSPAEQAVGS